MAYCCWCQGASLPPSMSLFCSFTAWIEIRPRCTQTKTALHGLSHVSVGFYSKPGKPLTHLLVKKFFSRLYIKMVAQRKGAACWCGCANSSRMVRVCVYIHVYIYAPASCTCTMCLPPSKNPTRSSSTSDADHDETHYIPRRLCVAEDYSMAPPLGLGRKICPRQRKCLLRPSHNTIYVQDPTATKLQGSTCKGALTWLCSTLTWP